MKNKQTELNVDFIGGERPLTKEDKKAFSDYLKNKKLLRTISHKAGHKASIHSRNKVTV